MTPIFGTDCKTVTREWRLGPSNESTLSCGALKHPLDVHFFRPWTVMPKSECPTQRGQKRRDSHAYSVTARLPLEGPQKRRPSDVRPFARPIAPPPAASTPAHATRTTQARRRG